MKKIIELVFYTVTTGLLCSAVITEITVDGVVKFSNITKVPSFAYLLGNIGLIGAYIYLKRFINKKTEELTKQIHSKVQSNVENQLKEQISQKVQHELKQHIASELKDERYKLKVSIDERFNSYKDKELKSIIHSEVIIQIEKSMELYTKTIEVQVYKIMMNQQNPNSQGYDIHQMLNRMNSQFGEKFGEVTDVLKQLQDSQKKVGATNDKNVV